VDTFLGVQHQRLVLFHLWRDETLGVDQCLLADVIGRRLVGCAARDFDVVTKDLVVAYLERFQACAFALCGFQVGDPLAGVTGGLDHAIQFSRVARADNASVLQRGRRVIVNRILKNCQLLTAFRPLITEN